MTITTTDDAGRRIALVDLLDRLLGTGVVLSGDVVISISGVDLVAIRLEALLTSVRADLRGEPAARDGGTAKERNR